ncbi:MAG: hypothetical protein ABSH17_07760, partial [Syntrophobacteraceae bacterium]
WIDVLVLDLHTFPFPHTIKKLENSLSPADEINFLCPAIEDTEKRILKSAKPGLCQFVFRMENHPLEVVT